MSGSVQVVSSTQNSTSNSSNGGTLAVNDSSSSSTTNTPVSGSPLIYRNNGSDKEYREYYLSIKPALPTRFTGVGSVSINGQYTGTGNNIRITSLSIQISFTEGLVGSLVLSFIGTISGAGTINTYQQQFGITNPTLQPNIITELPLNITITIKDAKISSSGILTADISLNFIAGFFNIDGGAPVNSPLAPGYIEVKFSGGKLSGSNNSLTKVEFTSSSITHVLF